MWNGLTDEWHPTQSLCDMLTMTEHSAKPLAELTLAYCGDARNNTANSLLVAGALMGMAVHMVAPRSLWNDQGRGRHGRADRPGDDGSERSGTPRTSRRASGAPTSSTPTCGSAWASRPRTGRSGSGLLRPYQINIARPFGSATANDDVKFMYTACARLSRPPDQDR